MDSVVRAYYLAGLIVDYLQGLFEDYKDILKDFELKHGDTDMEGIIV